MKIFGRISRTAVLLLGIPGVAAAELPDGMAGPYLAARLATIHSDYQVAAPYYDTLLRADATNPLLLEYALLSHLSLGDAANAARFAHQMDQLGQPSQAANLLILADLGTRGDFEAILAETDDGRPLGPLVLGLLRAWALLGAGQMSEASLAFDKVGETGGLAAFAAYHKALALASVGDFEGADEILSGASGTTLRATRRSVIAHAEVLSALERNGDAVDLIDAIFNVELDPQMAQLRARLAAGEPLPFTVITNATDGMAEVMLTVAGALSAESTDVYTLA